MFAIPEVRVGEPLSCGSLGVFPLYSERSLFPDHTLDYLLPNEAMEGGTVIVTEVSEAGSVPEVRVRNDGDLPVLMLDGTELRGGLQCRVLNTTVLLGGRSETLIPVSCVERGRWKHSSRDFSSGSHCPPSLRSVIKDGLPGAKVGHRSDQLRVWMEIRRKHERMGVLSETGDMWDGTGEAPGEGGTVEGGVPVSCRGQTGSPSHWVARSSSSTSSTRLRPWRKSGGDCRRACCLDLLEKPDLGRQVTSDISAELYRMRNLPWHEVQPVGLGEAFRARDNTMVADVLLHEGSLLHASDLNADVRHNAQAVCNVGGEEQPAHHEGERPNGFDNTLHVTSDTRSPNEARQLIEQLRRRALDLPFAEVGNIVELKGRNCDHQNYQGNDPLRWLVIQAGQYVEHGGIHYQVKPKHLVAFSTYPGEGSEQAISAWHCIRLRFSPATRSLGEGTRWTRD